MVFLDPVAPALEFLARHGLVALFLLLVIDSAGIPFPTEIVIIMAVAIYATDLASLFLIIGLTTLAAMIGSLLLYGLCFAGGRRLVEKRPRLFMMTPRRIARLERVFSRPAGQSLVLFLRLFPLTRILVSIPAGIARMRPAAFLLLTFLGMVIYHSVLVVLAFRYGNTRGGGASFQAALESPAWQYIQANHVVTVLVLIALGLVLSVMASRSTLKDPEWASPSRLGWLAERLAVFGGLLIIVLVVVDEHLVYRALWFGGLDLPALADRLDWDAGSFLVAAALVSIFVGLPALLLGRAARRRKEDWWATQHGLREIAVVTAKPAGAARTRPPRVRPGDRSRPPRGGGGLGGTS